MGTAEKCNALTLWPIPVSTKSLWFTLQILLRAALTEEIELWFGCARSRAKSRGRATIAECARFKSTQVAVQPPFAGGLSQRTQAIQRHWQVEVPICGKLFADRFLH